MNKIILLCAFTITIAGSSCTNFEKQNKQEEMQSEKHDSTHKEKEKADTLGMKMGGYELESKKK